MPWQTTTKGTRFEIFWSGDYDFTIDGAPPLYGWYWWTRAFGEAHGPFKNQNAAEADAEEVLSDQHSAGR